MHHDNSTLSPVTAAPLRDATSGAIIETCMKQITLFLTLLSLLLLGSCSGIKYLTVETREPAQVRLPSEVLSIAVANNAVTQPIHIGHTIQRVGHSTSDKTTASSDSIPFYLTEALTQFLEEEDYFHRVHFIADGLRNDSDFFREDPLLPEKLNKIRRETGAQAVISLDKLILETHTREYYRQQGYNYGQMTGKIESLIRVYLPTMEGKIPAVYFSDSLKWEGFDIRNENAYAEYMLPSREEAMKELVVRAAEKLTYVFVPHWEMQDRWYYTLPSSLMREGEVYAKAADWQRAIEKWENFHDKSSRKIDRAKAANNIALAYEMLDEMEQSLEWATRANELFVASTSPNSIERRRSLLYKNEITRRMSTVNQIDMNAM